MKNLILLLMLVMTGCAPATMQGLRDSYHEKISFKSDQNYQAVYRTLLNQSRECYQSTGLLGVDNVVQGDIYTDIQSGSIAIAQHNPMYGINTWMVIDISASAEKSSINVYCFNQVWCRNARGIEKWVSGSKSCHGPEESEKQSANK